MKVILQLLKYSQNRALWKLMVVDVMNDMTYGDIMALRCFG